MPSYLVKFMFDERLMSERVSTTMPSAARALIEGSPLSRRTGHLSLELKPASGLIAPRRAQPRSAALCH
jgi:hypothetical protein